nr:insulin-degrading enzyme, IDE, atrial natriuretic peptide (ANP)-binding protein=peptide 1 {EC 3.4.22.11} [rats, brain, Peptide Partial, 10 aa] [Rattus sp.]
EHPFQEEHLK